MYTQPASNSLPFQKIEDQIHAKEAKGNCYISSLKVLGFLTVGIAAALVIILILGATGVLPMSSVALGINAALLVLCLLIIIGIYKGHSCLKEKFQKNMANEHAFLETGRDLDAKSVTFRNFAHRYNTQKDSFTPEEVQQFLHAGQELYDSLGTALALSEKHGHFEIKFAKLYADLPGTLNPIAEEWNIDFHLDHRIIPGTTLLPDPATIPEFRVINSLV